MLVRFSKKCADSGATRKIGALALEDGDGHSVERSSDSGVPISGIVVMFSAFPCIVVGLPRRYVGGG